MRAVFMESIHTAFIAHPQQDEQAAGQAQGQPGDVDKRKDLALPEIAESDAEIVFEQYPSGKVPNF